MFIHNRAEGGELQKVLDDEESIQEKQCRRLIRQIIEGVQYLHQKRIAHLDIKVIYFYRSFKILI